MKRALVLSVVLGCRREVAPPAPPPAASAPPPASSPAVAPSASGVAPLACPGGHDAEAWSAPSVATARAKVTAKVVAESITKARIEAELVVDADGEFALDLGGRAGDTKARLDGAELGEAKNGAPLFVAARKLTAGRHALALDVTYGKHIAKVRAFGELAVGVAGTRRRGLVSRTFTSIDGSHQTLVAYLPRCVDLAVPRPVVVALPGWSNGPYTFAASKLLDEAERHGFVVLTPETRGNLLYTGGAEAGVLEALEVLARDVAIDRDRVHLTGVSMGGAGALQLGYHYPDRFASIVAFYGDSRYDRATYVGKILKTQQETDRYSVLLFPENARNLPVLLVHAQDDAVSPFSESKQLMALSEKLTLSNVRLVAPAVGGHTMEVFEQHVPDALATFLSARRVARPSRVTFRTNSAAYVQAYWLGLALTKDGAFGSVDATLIDGAVRVDRAEGVRGLTVDLAAAGLPRLVVTGAPTVPVLAR